VVISKSKHCNKRVKATHKLPIRFLRWSLQRDTSAADVVHTVDVFSGACREGRVSFSQFMHKMHET